MGVHDVWNLEVTEEPPHLLPTTMQQVSELDRADGVVQASERLVELEPQPPKAWELFGTTSFSSMSSIFTGTQSNEVVSELSITRLYSMACTREVLSNQDGLIQGLRTDPLEFSVTVQMALATDGPHWRRGAGALREAALHLETYTNAEDHLIVLSVNDGPCRDWNKNNKDTKIGPNDRILDIDGARGGGTADGLKEEMQKAGARLAEGCSVTMRIRRPLVFRMTLDRGIPPRQVGMRLVTEKELLLVDCVLPQGLAAEWNAKSPDVKVGKGDRVVAVNSVCGSNEELMEAVQDPAAGSRMQILVECHR